MNKENFYLASKDVAERTGYASVRYVAPDGRYVLSSRDLRFVRMTAEEYAKGLDVEMISSEEADRLIALGGYKMGADVKDDTGGQSTEEDKSQPELQEQVPGEDGPADGTEDTPAEDEPAETPVEDLSTVDDGQLGVDGVDGENASGGEKAESETTDDEISE